MDELKKKYNTQKSCALARGIDFDLTFDEWKGIWDGNFHKRGTASGGLGMLRTRDEGGYSVENVRLGTPKENAQERSVCQHVSKAQNWANVKAQDFYRKPPTQTSWIGKRGYVFDEYIEDEENT